MSHNKNHDSQQLPVGRLGIISPYQLRRTRYKGR